MSTKQRQWVLLACVAVARGSVCFPDALPPEQLKQLKHPNGEEYNVGVWVSDWSAAHVVSQLAITLIKEKLGFNVSEGKGAGTPNAVYALTGCRSPGNLMEPQCDADITYFHINLESWVEDYPQLWMDMQSRYPLMAPKNLGLMGYHGRTSIYIPTPILEAAYYGEGLSLGYYRGYNVTWNDPSNYFDRMSSIAQGRVKPCSKTRLTDSAIMKTYVEITGDLDGVMITGEQYAGNCPDEHFWISPACRAQHDRCIPFFTGGDGWDIEGYLQKSTSWNMPMAIAVAASWTDYQLLPLQFKSLFYWWVPDPTFLELVPEEVMFPPFDRLKWFAGDRRVSSPDIPIDKVVSQDLSMLAPNVEAFIQKFRIEMASVNEIMRETMNSEEGVEAETCKWLRANEKIWKSWLPDETECFPGFGLYDLVEQVYVHDRKEPVGKKCQACPSGTFSSKLVDDVGVTYICVQCPQGYSQPSGASLSCEECHEGKYQDQLGSRTCKPCGLSHYQDARGQASCKACPNDSTTVRIGSVSFLDCGCQKGQIDVSSPEEDLVCHSCPDGLHCPVMSRTQSFLDGVATSASEGVDLGSDFIPALLEGFHCTKTQPLKIFRCGKVEHCPGGAPGTCAGGRVGFACGECMADFRWTGKKCEVCGETRVVWATAIAGILGGLALMPVVLLPGHTTSSKATMIFTITCVFGLLAHNAQSVAVIGNLNVQWPTSWSAMFEYFQILLLDTESTGVVCLSAITSMPRYVASTLFFPCALAWMLLVYGLTRLLPRRFQWTLNKTLNAMGTLTQVGFTTMSQIAMVPWMCYSHPNGESSLFKYPNTLCNSAEHHGMLVAGLLLFAFVLGFLALCTYLAWTIPAKARTGSMVHLESARFLVFRFRLDRWWYGVPLLLKGPAMSIVMVVATDHPRVQNFLLLAVLELFLILGCLAWPWKVPAVNTLDVQGSLCLVLFAVLGFFCSPSRTETESNFADVSAATLLVYMALVVLVAGSLSCLSFLWRLLTGEDQWIQRFMNLGWTPTPAEVVQELKRVSDRVLMTEGGQLQQRVGEMVGGDLQRIMYCIDLIDVDLFHSESQLGLQRIMSSIMRRSSLAEAPESGTKSLHDGDEKVTESLEVSPATTGIKVEVAEERAAPQSDLDSEVQETIFGPFEERALVKEEL